MIAWLRRHTFHWKGLRTIVVARAYVILGILVELHDLAAVSFATIDWVPIVPEEWRPFVPLGIAATGFIFEGLRRMSTTPAAVGGEIVSGG